MNMWILLGLFMVMVVIAVLLKRQEHHIADYPYVMRESLFTSAERSFFGVLENVVGGQYRIFGKVRIADVIDVKKPQDKSQWQRAFNRISSKHFDYVLCKHDDLSVVCVVELDDQSHNQQKRQERDSFIEGLCKAISLPLLRVPAQRSYSIQDVKTQLDGLLS